MSKLDKVLEKSSGIKIEPLRNDRVSIYEKLQNVRSEINKMNLKKGGKNTFARYTYYELPDFLPQAQELFKKHRITPVFNIDEENAYLELFNWDDEKTMFFTTPVADATTLNKSGQPSNLAIQSLGSQHTYLKRYLYMNLLELSEHDGLEANTGNEEVIPKDVRKPKVELATDEQVEWANDLFDKERIKGMLEYYKVEKIKDIPKDELHSVITKQQEINKKAKEKEVSKAEKDFNETGEHIPSLRDII